MPVYGGFLEEADRAEGGTSVISSHEMECHRRWGKGSGFIRP